MKKMAMSKEERKAYGKKYREEHKEKAKEYSKKYYKNNKRHPRGCLFLCGNSHGGAIYLLSLLCQKCNTTQKEPKKAQKNGFPHRDKVAPLYREKKIKNSKFFYSLLACYFTYI